MTRRQFSENPRTQMSFFTPPSRDGVSRFIRLLLSYSMFILFTIPQLTYYYNFLFWLFLLTFPVSVFYSTTFRVFSWGWWAEIWKIYSISLITSFLYTMPSYFPVWVIRIFHSEVIGIFRFLKLIFLLFSPVRNNFFSPCKQDPG